MELVFKVQNILDRRAAEAVDTLVIVAYDTDVFVAPGQEGGQKILQIIGILVLVNEDIAEFALVVVPHLLKLLQKLDCQQNDIVEIHRIGGF